jgi:hypothetical protein
LQSQVNKAAKKRLSLSGLEILHERLGNTITMEAIGGGQPSQLILPSGTSFSAANA